MPFAGYGLIDRAARFGLVTTTDLPVQGTEKPVSDSLA